MKNSALSISLFLITCFLQSFTITSNTNYPSKADTLKTQDFSAGKLITEKFYLNGTLVKRVSYEYRKKYKRIVTITNPDAKPVTRQLIVYYPSGRLWGEGITLGWKAHGIIKSCFENGQNCCINKYIKGKLDSTQTMYHDNGQLWARFSYKNGKLMEVLENYDRLGSPAAKGTLKNGNGTVYRYDASGKLELIEHYENGKRKKKEKKSLS